MAEETSLVQPGFLLSKSRGGGDKGRSFESSRSSGKGASAHHRRVSCSSVHEVCKHGISDEHGSDGKKCRHLRKPAKEIGGMVGVKDFGVTAVIKKNFVGNPKPLGERKIGVPVREKGKQETVTASEHVDRDTAPQSASDIMIGVPGESEITEETDTRLLSDEKVKLDILVGAENEKVTAEETLSDTNDLSSFKKSCTLSKGKPTLLRLPSLISSGRTIDGWKSVNGQKILERGKSFDARSARMVVEGSRKSLDGRKRSDEVKSVDPKIMQKSDGNVSNVENDNDSSNSAVEMKSLEGSKSSPAKKGLVKSRSLNIKTNIKDVGLVNTDNNGKSETPEKQIAAAKHKILSMRPSRSLNPLVAKPSSQLLHHSSGSQTKTDGDCQVGKKISTSELDAKIVSKPAKLSPSSSSPSENGEKSSDTKKARVVRVLSSVRRLSKITKEAPKDLNDKGIPKDTADVIKQAPEKKSPASSKIKMTSSNALLARSATATQPTIRSRTSYLPSRVKKSPEETEQKLAAKDASPSGLSKSKAVELESENQRPSKLKVRSTIMAVETTTRRSYLKKDSPGTDARKNNSDKFLSGRPIIRRKKTSLSNKVIEETANRLIRTRKSKVMALIGAFETVISIQKKSSARLNISKAKKRISSSKVSR